MVTFIECLIYLAVGVAVMMLGLEIYEALKEEK